MFKEILFFYHLNVCVTNVVLYNMYFFSFKKIIWSFRVLEFKLEKEHEVVEKRYDVR